MEQLDAAFMKKIKRLHFVGIGGSGMFPIVQILHAAGYTITGSDVNEGDIINYERAMGIDMGQFADTPRDTVFTTEYSVRTAMEAVYGLLGVDRGVPEVWGSVYDIRELNFPM